MTLGNSLNNHTSLNKGGSKLSEGIQDISVILQPKPIQCNLSKLDPSGTKFFFKFRQVSC